MDASRSRDLVNGIASRKDKSAIMLRRVSSPYEQLPFARKGFLDLRQENKASISLACISRIDFRAPDLNLMEDVL